MRRIVDINLFLTMIFRYYFFSTRFSFIHLFIYKKNVLFKFID